MLTQDAGGWYGLFQEPPVQGLEVLRECVWGAQPVGAGRKEQGPGVAPPEGDPARRLLSGR